MYVAVEEGHLAVVITLVQAKCDLHRETFRGKMPLYAAAEQVYFCLGNVPFGLGFHIYSIFMSNHRAISRYVGYF